MTVLRDIEYNQAMSDTPFPRMDQAWIEVCEDNHAAAAFAEHAYATAMGEERARGFTLKSNGILAVHGRNRIAELDNLRQALGLIRPTRTR